jgi:hypothetical protein
MATSGYSRRTFLKNSTGAMVAASVARVAAVPAPVAAPHPGISPLNKWPGRCVVNYNSSAISGREGMKPSLKRWWMIPS